MAIKLILNKKTIWDNTEFEYIINNNLLNQPRSYLPVKSIDDEVVSIGGWKINVKSTIDRNATSSQIVEGYNTLSTKLNLNVQGSFLPFFAGDIWDYDPKEEVQKTRAVYEPLVVIFLRLCYWYHKCYTITPSLESKNKEIRNKLKVSDALVSIIKNSGFGDNQYKEWVRQATGVVYELMCAKKFLQKSRPNFLQSMPNTEKNSIRS